LATALARIAGRGIKAMFKQEEEKYNGIFGYKLEAIDYILIGVFFVVFAVGYTAFDRKIDLICGYAIAFFVLAVTTLIFFDYLRNVLKFSAGGKNQQNSK
jgi:hypothetical protein